MLSKPAISLPLPKLLLDTSFLTLFSLSAQQLHCTSIDLGQVPDAGQTNLPEFHSVPVSKTCIILHPLCSSDVSTISLTTGMHNLKNNL